MEAQTKGLLANTAELQYVDPKFKQNQVPVAAQIRTTNTGRPDEQGNVGKIRTFSSQSTCHAQLELQNEFSGQRCC